MSDLSEAYKPFDNLVNEIKKKIEHVIVSDNMRSKLEPLIESRRFRSQVSTLGEVLDHLVDVGGVAALNVDLLIQVLDLSPDDSRHEEELVKFYQKSCGKDFVCPGCITANIPTTPVYTEYEELIRAFIFICDKVGRYWTLAVRALPNVITEGEICNIEKSSGCDFCSCSGCKECMGVKAFRRWFKNQPPELKNLECITKALNKETLFETLVKDLEKRLFLYYSVKSKCLERHIEQHGYRW